MIRFRPTSISHKFILGLMGITVVVMVVFSTIMILVNYRTGERHLSENLVAILEKSRVSLPSALWSFNHEYVNDYIDSLFLNEDLVFARVAGGDVEIKSRIRPRFEHLGLAFFKDNNRFMVTEQPIQYREYRVGNVVLVLSRDRITRLAFQNSAAVILIAFCNIIAIFITTYVLSRRNIFKPLSRLEASVHAVTRGNLDAKIDAGSRDEIGTLAKAFDQMIHHLKTTTASKEELEREIRERRIAEEQSLMLGKVLEKSANEIYIFDSESLQFVMVNQGARENIGYSMPELETMTPLDVKPEFSEDGFRAMLKPLFMGTRTGIRFKTVHRRKDGSEYPIEAFLQLMRFKTRVVFVAIIQDISERVATDQKMMASVREKEVLLREIHHRVKNNMQIIQSLLNLQMTKTDSPWLKLALQDSNNRIKSMALVHETLYQSQDLASLDIKKYIEHIINYLSRIYQEPDTRVEISLDMDEISFDLDRSIACGLIINELVTNSLKYAFKGRSRGRIRVGVKRDKDNARLVVADNGNGLPTALDLENIESLGLKLVRMLVEDQLDGSIDIRQGDELAFHIVLPVKDEETY